ncbi:MAG: response regulator [Polyangiales bacterium]
MSLRILLIDDERDTRELLARALERSGYSCVTAATASEAHEHMESESRFDLVVTDVVLGNDDRGGLALLHRIRQRDPRALVLVITAYADVEKVKFALNEGAAYLIEKPFKAAELCAAVERVRAEGDVELALDRVFETAHLTDKERTVARHLLAGLTSNEIAQLENNSPKTIRQHVSQIYGKCDVGNRAEFLRLVYTR